ncbi:MAG: hypothetical protein IPK07_29810 [Deltaproteobacteria bacterium]|nr:hypothetical protein [Deltaproteobacteria bacterium]
MKRLAGLVLAAALVGGCGGDSGGGGGAAPATPGPLAVKAAGYDANHVAWHQTAEFGSRVETRFAAPDSTEVVLYDDLGDSTFWTGQYAASQAFRFAVTGDAEARANALRAASALHHHYAATGKRGFVGRFVGSIDEPALWAYAQPCTDENCHVVTEGPYAGHFWLGNTSRDQYTGWFYGLSLVHDLVGDPATNAVIEQDMREVIERLDDDRWRIVDVDGEDTTAGPGVLPLQQLMFTIAARDATGDAALAALFDQSADFLTALEPISTITWPNTYTEYYGISLGYLASYNLVRLETDAERRAGHVKTMTEQQYPPVANTHQVFFDYVWMVETGERPEALLADARSSLFEFPDAPKRRIHPYHPPMEKDPLSVIAGPLLTALGLGDVIDIGPRSKDPYPMSQRCVSGDYWQASPWTLECGGDDPAFEYAGEDYLHAYWMGRYHGFLTAAD